MKFQDVSILAKKRFAEVQALAVSLRKLASELTEPERPRRKSAKSHSSSSASHSAIGHSSSTHKVARKVKAAKAGSAKRARPALHKKRSKSSSGHAVKH